MEQVIYNKALASKSAENAVAIWGGLVITPAAALTVLALLNLPAAAVTLAVGWALTWAVRSAFRRGRMGGEGAFQQHVKENRGLTHGHTIYPGD